GKNLTCSLVPYILNLAIMAVKTWAFGPTDLSQNCSLDLWRTPI
ncbi:hypothetical protein GCK32_005908, partial [Trichostrongylus colubriformis]